MDYFDGNIDGLVTVLALEGVGGAFDNVVFAVWERSPCLIELFGRVAREGLGAGYYDNRNIASGDKRIDIRSDSLLFLELHDPAGIVAGV